VLLDTNVVIAFLGGERAVTARIPQTGFVLSSTVLGELYYGARKSARAATNLSHIDELAASAAVLPCDDVTAQYYGKIKDGLRRKGHPIPENDIWIAAVAMQYGLPVATRDAHFNEVEALLVENW
jgi:tRNA(fMet)-specific endonuclease VapC